MTPTITATRVLSIHAVLLDASNIPCGTGGLAQAAVWRVGSAAFTRPSSRPPADDNEDYQSRSALPSVNVDRA